MDKNTKDIIDSIDFDKLVADALREEKEKKKSGAKDQAKKKKPERVNVQKEKPSQGSQNDQKTAGKTKDNKTTINENKSDIGQDIKDNIKDNAAGGADASGGLPFDLLQTLQTMIKEWCIDNDIESMQKAASLQWGACCMFIGQYIKHNKILYDAERTAARGGVCCYDIKKVSALVDLWAYLCKVYKKTPLVTDFIDFSGVARAWFYSDNGHNNNTLTSAGGGIAKKLTDIQAAAIGSGIVDGRENPTGKIYFSKAVLGWSETSGGISSADDRTEKVQGLPDLSVLELPKL